MTEATAISATLPTALKETLTGKNAATSSPAPGTLNSRLPDVLSSDEETSGVDQSSVEVEGFRDHSPVAEDITGEDTALHNIEGVSRCISDLMVYERQGDRN